MRISRRDIIILLFFLNCSCDPTTNPKIVQCRKHAMRSQLSVKGSLDKLLFLIKVDSLKEY